MEEEFKSSWNQMFDKIQGWWDAIIINIPNIALALIAFITAFILAKQIRKWVNRLLRNKMSQPSMRDLVANLISIVIIALGFFLALSVLNLDKALNTILAGAGVAGLAVGLALQGALSNTFSGIYLSIKDILNLGDFVETNGYSGTIQEINLRYVKLLEADNNCVIIPNRLILENPFKNYGLTTQIRTTIECGVAYDSNLHEVEDLAIKTIKELFDPGNKEIEFYFREFGDSSINFMMRFWVDAKESMTLLKSKSLAIKALKDAFDEAGIEIPFPIRTLYMANQGIGSHSQESQKELL